MNAVRFAASAGVMPFICSRRKVALVSGAARAPLVVEPVVASDLRLVIERERATPGPAVGSGAARGNEEAGRDDRPCPRDPRDACPAMAHVSLLSPIPLPLPPDGPVRCGERMVPVAFT